MKTISCYEPDSSCRFGCEHTFTKRIIWNYIFSTLKQFYLCNDSLCQQRSGIVKKMHLNANVSLESNTNVSLESNTNVSLESNTNVSLQSNINAIFQERIQMQMFWGRTEMFWLHICKCI